MAKQQFVAPQLATLVADVPTADGWTFEIKYDGYRLQALLHDREVRLLTRRGNDWTARFPHIATRLARIPVDSATLDGELVALDASGKSVFHLLQQNLDGSDDHDLVFFAFDILYLDGTDLREEPLTERRVALSRLLRRARATARGAVRLGQQMPGTARTVMRAACTHGLEGVIGKRLDAPYASGRNRNWIKAKCGKRQEFVVVGFTPPQRSRVGLGSLLLGVNERGKLRYAGRVGSGFADSLLRRLLKALGGTGARQRAATEPSPGDSRRRAMGQSGDGGRGCVHRVDTGRVVASSGLSRDSRGQGRARCSPGAGTMSEPRARKRATLLEDASSVAGIGITHPDRVVFPETGITKLQVARYFESVADLMLPHVAGRPLALVRCPEGSGHECFFQKHWIGKQPPAIDTVGIRQNDGKVHPHVVVHDVAGLVTLAQWGVLEIHPWGARADDPERPDRIIFDLDPGPGVSWAALQEATLGVRSLLDEIGLESWVKTSGGKGLHVALPIARRSTWDDVSAFAAAVAERMAREFPARFVAQASKAKRNGRIFVDWLRNTRGATAVGPWSTRARAEAGVSVPIAWPQVNKVTAGDQFTLRALGVKRPKSDPWREMLASDQRLTKAMLARLKR